MELMLLFGVAAVLAVLTFLETTYLTIMKLRQRTLKVARGSILLDTSAIMDGRIIDIAKSGIITAELIIPRSVIREMQLLADKADHEKRVRARKGLDNIRELQKLDSVSVTVVNDGLVDHGGVDERLLNLAQKYDASIATTDYNLNKVAKVINITVINVNELAQMLRAQHLPGDIVEIELIQPGANREQAVGYLNDGTMVVVEDSKNQIGQKMKVEIVRSLQTEAGRMMFAKKVSHNANHSNNNDASRKSKAAKLVKTKATASHIKSAPAFHSDQLKRAAEPTKSTSSSDEAHNVRRGSTLSGRKNTRTTSEANRQTRADKSNAKSKSASSSDVKTTHVRKSRTSKSAEQSMVALANRIGQDK